MKGLNGIELIDKLKKRILGVKILVLSNHENELVREAMKKGADDYLLKITLRAKGIQRYNWIQV